MPTKRKKVIFLIILAVSLGFFAYQNFGSNEKLTASLGFKNEKQADSLNFKNVLLIGWDGVQRNHLMELLEEERLPHLKQLSSEGSLIPIDITTGATQTKPGWAQILTGYDPQISGVYANRDYRPIPKGYTLPERLENYFKDSNIITVFLSGKENNLGTRGLHKTCTKNCGGAYRYDKKPTTFPPAIIKDMEGDPYFISKNYVDIFENGLGTADAVGPKALEYIEKFKEDNMFLFIAFQEPDVPGGHDFGENSKEYSEGIILVDKWLGQIVQKLKELDIYEETLIYVTSDHGFDEGGVKHLDAPYVFLATNDSMVQAVKGNRKDITPTILHRYGIDINSITPTLDGVSLIKKESMNNRRVFEIWRNRIDDIKNKGMIPIIDTEATYWNEVDISLLMEYMDDLGVALMAFAPDFVNPEQGSVESLKLHQRYPQYFVPTIADGTTGYWTSQEGPLMAKIEEEALSGNYYFMGEFELRHYMSTREFKEGQKHRDVSISPDSAWVHKIFNLASELQITFQIHNDLEDEMVKRWEKILAQYPGALVIWTHLGLIRYPDRQTVYSPVYIDELLTRFPNLYFDLAVSIPGRIYPGSGFIQNTLQNSSGDLLPEWKSLIEKHPDRFTIGSDIAPVRFGSFIPKIQNARSILAQLSDSTAEKVAYKNAWYLITRSEWDEEI